MKHAMLKAGALALCLVATQAWATNWLKVAEKAAQSIDDRSATVQHRGTIEYAFSPREGGEKLVLKVIDSAQSEIRVMAYALTSARIVEALIQDRRPGGTVGACHCRLSRADDLGLPDPPRQGDRGRQGDSGDGQL